MLDVPFSYRTSDAVKLTLLFLLIQFACGLLIGVVGGVLRVFGLGSSFSAMGPISISVINICSTAAVLAYGLKRAQARPGDVLVFPLPSVRAFGALLVTLVGFILLYSEIDNLVGAVAPAPDWVRRMFDDLSDSAQHPWASIFALVVMAPITEELVFRGFILRRLLTSMPAWTAIWISSLLFMALHLNPWQFPITLTLGLLAGWIYARSRSLVLCIAAHAIVNSLGFFITGLPFQIDGFNVQPIPGDVVFQPWWFDLLGLSIFAGGIYLLTRTTPSLPPPPSRPEPPPFLPAGAPPPPVIAGAGDPPQQ